MIERRSAPRVVVTGGDAGYFPLIEDLAASIRAFRSADELGLAIIDGGLLPEQARRLVEHYGARILDMGWGFEISPSRVRGREHLKVLTSRTFLDQHLPEAELIAWIDGDCWVQDIRALDMLFDGASTGRLAVVSQTSRYAALAMSVRWAAFGYAQVRSILYKNARRSGVPERDARIIGDKPTMNAGVFALRRDAPHWAAWRARQAQVLKKGRVFVSDQLALGMIVYLDGLPVELAPEICNYMGPHWKCSADEKTLVEKYIPNAPVGIVHLAGYDAMRLDPELTAPIETADGRVVHKSLRRAAWLA